MRRQLVRLHRWFGVATALFLFVAGLTGAIIAWDHELDAALNPSFYLARTAGPTLPGLELANRVEAADPRLRVTYLPLEVEPGHALQMMVLPRTDPATKQPYPLDFNQIAVDPVTGKIQGRREWGAVSLARLNLIPFIYKLHYTLQLPFTGGVDIGTWLMGIVGIVWLFDSVIALCLSFPSLKAWRKSFAFRVKRGGYALTFDLHRSGGVWIWGLLAIVALTSISMNLSSQVVRPIVSRLSTLTPDPFSNPEILRAPPPGEQVLSRERIVELAQQAGKEMHVAAPPAGSTTPNSYMRIASASTRPATTTAPPASATRGCIGTPPPASGSPRGFPVKARPAISSCRCSIRCTRGAFSDSAGGF
ncbi:putative iron-regulated membrane protein [Paraburkholderia youngii]